THSFTLDINTTVSTWLVCGNMSTIRTGDGQGNIWAETGILKSFFINERGEINYFEEQTFLPSWKYQVINFPYVKSC
ncbi:MAG: hypothetical protein KGZ63_00110, partial [Clostridiales bacterium]|nr:hypothetical protein [Clostridiales bacterium]